MKAVTVQPLVKDSVRFEDVPEPDERAGPILVEAVAVGVCGTDVEIVVGRCRRAPPGQSASSSATSPWVASSIRAGPQRERGRPHRRDRTPARSRALPELRGGRVGHVPQRPYTERGIKQIDGFMSERWRIEPGYFTAAGPVTRPARRAARADDRGGQGLGAGERHARAGVLAAEACPGDGSRPDRHAGGPHRGPERSRRPRAGPGHRGRQAGPRARPGCHLPLRCDRRHQPTTRRRHRVHRRGSGHRGLHHCGRRGRRRLPHRRRAAAGPRAGCRPPIWPRPWSCRTTSSSARSTPTGDTSIAAAEALAAADRAWLGRLISRRVAPEDIALRSQRSPDDIKVVLDFGG